MLLVLGASLLLSRPIVAQKSPYTAKEIPPPAKKTARVQITEGPALESSRAHEATAKSHIRLNRNHAYTIFRVRVERLKPGTAYYYSVASMNADGTEDGVKSGIYHFTTPGGA